MNHKYYKLKKHIEWRHEQEQKVLVSYKDNKEKKDLRRDLAEAKYLLDKEIKKNREHTNILTEVSSY